MGSNKIWETVNSYGSCSPQGYFRQLPMSMASVKFAKCFMSLEEISISKVIACRTSLFLHDGHLSSVKADGWPSRSLFKSAVIMLWDNIFFGLKINSHS